MRRISIGINWQGGLDLDAVVEQVKVADDSGVDSIFVAEAWGRDAFTVLAILARETSHITLGTGIVNIYSRTPAALAQHFGTLDELTGGRMAIGLGTSSANVSDHFHGVKFGRPLTRMREYVEIINTLMAGERLYHDGYYFKEMSRGFTLRDVNLPRAHIPIYIASITPKSVQQTAEIADGWLPIYVPREKWREQTQTFFDHVRAAGRDPQDVTIRSGSTVVVTDDPERGYEGIAQGTAFYIARMGDFYYDHFVRMGYGGLADAVRAGWAEGGPAGAAGAIPHEMRRQLGCAGSAEECAEWIDASEEAGYAMQSVGVSESDPGKLAETYRALVG